MVAILCMAALQLVNFVRSAQFNEEIVSGSLVLLAQRLHNDPDSLAELSARFDADIRILPDEQGPKDSYERTRLDRGQVLITTSSDGRTAHVLRRMPENQWLDVSLNTVTEVQAQATAYLILEDWQRSGESIDDFLVKMRP
ncbi:MAG: hypothetical protein COB58_09565, partial [Thalassobium sp.]